MKTLSSLPNLFVIAISYSFFCLLAPSAIYASSSNPALSYSVQNERVVEENDTLYYAFDVIGEVASETTEMTETWICMSYSADAFGYDLAFDKKAKFELADAFVNEGVIDTPSDGNNVFQDSIFEYYVAGGGITITPDTPFDLVTIKLPFDSSSCGKKTEIAWERYDEGSGLGIRYFSLYSDGAQTKVYNTMVESIEEDILLIFIALMV